MSAPAQATLPLTVTIIALNEERHIEKALRSVRWAKEIIVVDSGSTDRTVELARANCAIVFHNPWPGYGQQKNFAQQKATQPWILNIDADERVSPALAAEIQSAIAAHPDAGGFEMPRRTYYLGRWIRHGGWYPNVIRRLTRRDQGRWTEPPVHEDLEIQGPVLRLSEPLDHDAFGSIQEQILTNLRYSRLGSETLAQRGCRPSVAKLLYKPFGKFVETFILKAGWRDGLPGFLISINAAHSIFLKYAYLFEPQILNSESSHGNQSAKAIADR